MNSKYDNISSRLNDVSEIRMRYNDSMASSHENSLIYQKDIESTLTYFNKGNEYINDLKSAISAVQGKIDTGLRTSFHNTYRSLKKLNGQISGDELNAALDILKEKSAETYNSFVQLYNENDKQIAELISTISGDLSKMEANITKIKTYKKELKNEEDELEQQELKGDIEKCEAKINSYYSTCDNNLKNIIKLLQNNEKILEGGLKKAA